jgi:hypothetical protein
MCVYAYIQYMYKCTDRYTKKMYILQIYSRTYIHIYVYTCTVCMYVSTVYILVCIKSCN